MTRPASTPKSKARDRSRGWSVVSNYLKAEHIQDFIDTHAQTHPEMRAVGAVHDRDHGVPDGHVFFHDPASLLSKSTVETMFPVLVRVQKHIVFPGEPEPSTGRYALARGARYLTHEHPDQQAMGKALYSDDEIMATPGWDWRADVDALNRYEGVDADAQRVGGKTLLERVEEAVLRGEMTSRDVFEKHPRLYMAKGKGAKHWDSLERKASEWAEQDAARKRQAEQAQEARRRKKQEEERERQRQQKAAEEKAAAEKAAAERKAAEEKEAAEAAAAAEKRRAEEEAYRHSPEGQAEAARKAEQQRYRRLVDYAAMWLEIPGEWAQREAGVRKAVQAGSQIEEENGEITSEGPYADVEELLCDYMVCSPEEIDEQISLDRRNMQADVRNIAKAELAAADGDPVAFEEALRLRLRWARYPGMVRLPQVRSDIRKAWREKLLYVTSDPIGYEKATESADTRRRPVQPAPQPVHAVETEQAEPAVQPQHSEDVAYRADLITVIADALGVTGSQEKCKAAVAKGMAEVEELAGAELTVANLEELAVAHWIASDVADVPRRVREEIEAMSEREVRAQRMEARLEEMDLAG